MKAGMALEYVSIFSGIEAASVAWEPLGWKPLAFSENDRFPSAVLKERYPGVPNLGDITRIDWSEHEPCLSADIVVGGSPCQSFSLAGARTGLEGASGLMWEYVRAVREIRPRWIVWENVPGAFSSSHGEDFRCLLQALDELGYGLAWRVLDAQYFGVAQRRRRVFLVGSLGSPRAGEVLFESESLRWDHPTGRQKRQALAGTAQAGVGKADRQAGLNSGGNDVVRERGGFNDAIMCVSNGGTNAAIEVDMSPTLTAHDAKSTSYVFSGQNSAKAGLSLDKETCPTLSTTKKPQVMLGDLVRRLTPMEFERLQGFPDGWTDIPYRGKQHAPDSARYRALGNSMAVTVMAWIGSRIGVVEGKQ